MKFPVKVIVTVAIVTPAISFGQSSHPLTRTEVRQQVIELEKAGYRPVAEDLLYPADIQAAQARVDAQKGEPSDTAGARQPNQ